MPKQKSLVTCLALGMVTVVLHLNMLQFKHFIIKFAGKVPQLNPRTTVVCHMQVSNAGLAKVAFSNSES